MDEKKLKNMYRDVSVPDIKAAVLDEIHGNKPRRPGLRPKAAVLAAIIAVLVALVIFFHFRNKKKGKGSCSCGCSGCAMSDICHGAEKK